MKVKTCIIIGPPLDWAVAKCRGEYVRFDGRVVRYGPAQFSDEEPYSPSTNWAQGGPIIESEKIEIRPGLYHSTLWSAWGQTQHGHRNSQQGKTGPAPLIAAMRCYVSSKLGDEVDVPDNMLPPPADVYL